MHTTTSRRDRTRRLLKRGLLAVLLASMTVGLQGCALLSFLGQIMGMVAPMLGGLGGGGGGGGGGFPQIGGGNFGNQTGGAGNGAVITPAPAGGGGNIVPPAGGGRQPAATYGKYVGNSPKQGVLDQGMMSGMV